MIGRKAWFATGKGQPALLSAWSCQQDQAPVVKSRRISVFSQDRFGQKTTCAGEKADVLGLVRNS